MAEAEELSYTQHIIYMLFVIVLSITGIYIAFTFLGDIEIAVTFQDYGSRLNTVASRLMLTPSCFASDSSYTLTKDGRTYSGRQVDAGIIDFNKLPANKIIPESCNPGENQIWTRLEDFDETDNSKKVVTLWSCPDNLAPCQGETEEKACAQQLTADSCREYADCSWNSLMLNCQGSYGKAVCSSHATKSLCEKHANCRWAAPCQEPSFDSWKKESRTFLVLIKKNEGVHKGNLTVRLRG